MLMIQIYDEEDEKTISEYYLGKFFSIKIKFWLKTSIFLIYRFNIYLFIYLYIYLCCYCTMTGYMSGRGVMRYVNGERYEGEFRNGMYYREGKYTFLDGGYYEGEYKNLRPNPVTFLDFPLYDNLRHGFGVRAWSNGSKYHGQWLLGLMDGQGVTTTIMNEKHTGKG